MSADADSLNILTLLKSSKKYSDLQLVCEGQEFPVHKSIVCTQSTVLAAACDGDFQEAATSQICIEEFDAKTVERMIAFFYEKDYRDGTDESVSEEPVQAQTEATELNLFALMQVDPFHAAKSTTTREILLQHVRVNAIADYYDVAKLKRLANVKIQHLLETSWSADDFSNIIQQALDSTSDKDLRGLMVLTTARHIEELLELEDFITLHITSDFFLDVIRSIKSMQEAKDSSFNCKIQEIESQLDSEKLGRQAEEIWGRTASDRADRIIEKIDDCRKVLQTHNKCRNTSCDAEFMCYIERGVLGGDPTYLLRCERCNCRHRS